MLVRHSGHGVSLHFWTDHRQIDRCAATQVRALSAFVEGDKEETVAAGLKIRGAGNRAQGDAPEAVGRRPLFRHGARRHADGTIVGIVISIGDDDHESGQGLVCYVGREFRQIDDFSRGSVYIFQNVAVPGGGVMTPVVGSVVVVIRSSDRSTRAGVLLCVYLPRNARIVEFTKDVVVGNGIGGRRVQVVAIVPRAIEIMSSRRQGAVGAGMATAG